MKLNFEQAKDFIKTYDGQLAIFCDGGWDHVPYSNIYFCPSYDWGIDGQRELAHISFETLKQLQSEQIVCVCNHYGSFKNRKIFEVHKAE